MLLFSLFVRNYPQTIKSQVQSYYFICGNKSHIPSTHTPEKAKSFRAASNKILTSLSIAFTSRKSSSAYSRSRRFLPLGEIASLLTVDKSSRVYVCACRVLAGRGHSGGACVSQGRRGQGHLSAGGGVERGLPTG